MQRKHIMQSRSSNFYENLLKGKCQSPRSQTCKKLRIPLYATDHLDHLVHSKSLSDVLSILPAKYIGIESDGTARSQPLTELEDSNTFGAGCSSSKAEIVIEPNESALFTQYLKMAIDRDRSERLSDMIKTTGYQLFNSISHSSTSRGLDDSAAADNDVEEILNARIERCDAK